MAKKLKKHTPRYVILADSTMGGLEQIVEAHLVKGWTFVGGIVIVESTRNYTWYYQSMTHK